MLMTLIKRTISQIKGNKQVTAHDGAFRSAQNIHGDLFSGKNWLFRQNVFSSVVLPVTVPNVSYSLRNPLVQNFWYTTFGKTSVYGNGLSHKENQKKVELSPALVAFSS